MGVRTGVHMWVATAVGVSVGVGVGLVRRRCARGETGMCAYGHGYCNERSNAPACPPTYYTRLHICYGICGIV